MMSNREAAMNKSKNDQENGTQSIERALSILNCFSRGTENLSLTEISKIVGIPYSTASRITGILEKESFLYLKACPAVTVIVLILPCEEALNCG
ncbi:hypothetical protein EOM86_11345 [Candidatus Nomurabacteria bacterium]|nr:hypothetical protein [Candidatus Nomurabacteria bacterium]